MPCSCPSALLLTMVHNFQKTCFSFLKVHTDIVLLNRTVTSHCLYIRTRNIAKKRRPSVPLPCTPLHNIALSYLHIINGLQSRTRISYLNHYTNTAHNRNHEAPSPSNRRKPQEIRIHFPIPLEINPSTNQGKRHKLCIHVPRSHNRSHSSNELHYVAQNISVPASAECC